MLHLRVVTASPQTDAVLDLLRRNDGTTNLLVVRGAALEPPGDLVMCDLAREVVNEVVGALRDLDVHRRGSIALEHIDVSVSDVAQAAERLAPGYGSEAAVWEEVDARVRDESHLTASFLAFLVVASLIAAAGLIEDSAVLIVGAMVVGPEFGPIAGLSVGLFKRRASRIRLASRTLVVGLGVGVLAAYLATALADLVDLGPEEFVPGDQPVTGFIVDPSLLSFVVAFLAGIAGTLSLTQAKAGALIGVLISVTTIPAVAAIGVSAAFADWPDALAAVFQLALNVGALVVAGVLTLWVQREAWARLAPPRLRRAGR